MKKLNTNSIVNSILCCSNAKIPVNNTHYITTKGLLIFKDLACIESNLTNLTCKIKNCCSNLKCLRKYK